MIRKFFYTALICLLYIPAAISAPSSWTVKDGDTTITLLGTFHLGKADMNWLTDATLAKIQASDRLFLEVAPEETTPEAMTPIIMAHGRLPQNQSLPTILSPAMHRKLLDYLYNKGMPVGSFDHMRPWLAANVISINEFQARGLSPEFGAERLVTSKAVEKNIRIFGLETAEEQIALFSSLSFEDEVEFLSSTLDDVGKADVMIEGLITAWLTGDDAKLHRLMSSELKRIPGMEKKLIHNRNENWAKQIKKMMDEPGQIFIAVGAGHLVGERGVPILLKEAGYTVSKN